MAGSKKPSTKKVAKEDQEAKELTSVVYGLPPAPEEDIQEMARGALTEMKLWSGVNRHWSMEETVCQFCCLGVPAEQADVGCPGGEVS